MSLVAKDFVIPLIMCAICVLHSLELTNLINYVCMHPFVYLFSMGDNGRQCETTGDNGRQWDTMGDNGRQQETTGDNVRQREITGDTGRQRATT